MIDSSRQTKSQALSGLLILTGLCLLGIVVFSAVGIFFGSVFSGLNITDLQNIAVDYETIPNARIALLIMQGIISIGGFVLFPWTVRFFNKENQYAADKFIFPSITLLILVFALSLLMMPVNAWLAAWNESIHLPQFLSEFKDWASQKENEMQQLTIYLIDFQTTSELILGFVVISLIAGFSEEFFFRRMLQPRVYALTGNIHVAIWVTAFLFSAIHFQFFGLVPRMVLGALFGYYFWWTGNFWISVLAHSLNNGITLIGMYLYTKNISPIDVENPKIVPWYIGAVAAGITWSLAIMMKDESDKIRDRKRNVVVAEAPIGA